MGNREDVYAATEDTTERTPRHLRHFTLRTLDAAGIARFYHDVFDLQEQPKDAADPNHYLSDGVVTLVIAPWVITDYQGSGIERPALDHLGFHVESLERFQADLDELVRSDPALQPRRHSGWGRRARCARRCSPPAASASCGSPTQTACSST